MPEHSFEIAAYDVDLHPSPEGATRSLRLLDDKGTEKPDNIAYLNFYPDDQFEPRRQLGITSSVISVTANVRRGEYEHFYHLLQTEKPVFLYAQYEDGDGPIQEITSFGITTDLESVGEGFEDWSF